VGLAVGKALGEWSRSKGGELGALREPSRRAARSLVGVKVDDWRDLVCRWSAELTPVQLRAPSPGLDPAATTLLALRFGWGPERPRTIEEIARSIGATRARASERVQRAIAQALAAGKGGPGGGSP
jgi:hypothetical protein